MTSASSFRFFRAGGFDQVRFETGHELLRLEQLDWKLWVALACPVKGLAFDARTLELIDSDHDGRIRAPELIAAVKWAGRLLKNADDLMKGSPELPLSAINTEDPEGKILAQAAHAILHGLGKSDASAIAVSDSTAALKAFHQRAFNGDGVVPLESAKTDGQKQLIQDIMATVGSADDASGKKGVTVEQTQAFFAAVSEYMGWWAQGESDATLMPLKAATGAGFQTFVAVRGKIDDYFARCALAAFDPRAIAALNREEKEFLALAAKDLTITSDEVKAFPLARIEGKKALPLTVGLNPAWAETIKTFLDKTVRPLMGERTTLLETEWAQVKTAFGPFEAWQASKKGTLVEKLGNEQLKVLHGADARSLLDPLFDEEKAQEPHAQAITSVEKLARYSRDLFRLANNFVSFRDFYEGQRPAVFQVGTLFLDQRECDLVIRVEDVAKHATLAPLSRGYLAYCECSRPASGEKMTVVAVFTDGDLDNLMVGRNGLLKDRDGRDWDATITKLVENPISIRQAFLSPYKKLLRFVEEQVNKRAARAEASSHEQLTQGTVALAAHAEGPAQPPPEPKKFDVGVVAALGVAVGGITAALGALLQAVFGLGMWMPLGFLGLLLIISGPSMFIAWFKLRQRNIGPLLDANGWAVNAQAMINVPFGRSLTKTAKLPAGATLDRSDPYANRHWPLIWAVLLVVLVSLGLAWHFGKLDSLLSPNNQNSQSERK